MNDKTDIRSIHSSTPSQGDDNMPLPTFTTLKELEKTFKNSNPSSWTPWSSIPDDELHQGYCLHGNKGNLDILRIGHLRTSQMYADKFISMMKEIHNDGEVFEKSLNDLSIIVNGKTEGQEPSHKKPKFTILFDTGLKKGAQTAKRILAREENSEMERSILLPWSGEKHRGFMVCSGDHHSQKDVKAFVDILQRAAQCVHKYNENKGANPLVPGDSFCLVPQYRIVETNQNSGEHGRTPKSAWKNLEKNIISDDRVHLTKASPRGVYFEADKAVSKGPPSEKLEIRMPVDRADTDDQANWTCAGYGYNKLKAHTNSALILKVTRPFWTGATHYNLNQANVQESSR